MGLDILQPVVALAAWTMVMWAWMYATRIPAMMAAKIDPDSTARDPDLSLARVLPPHVRWKADNYNHLHEAPTVFYAVAIFLAVTGHRHGLSAAAAWLYVALRIAHSLAQATVNRVTVRFGVFVLSSLVLLALVIRAALVVF